MSKYTRSQQVAELLTNGRKLENIRKGELNKILYSNNVSDDVVEMIHKIGKRAMNTKIICCPRRRVIISHKELRLLVTFS